MQIILSVKAVIFSIAPYCNGILIEMQRLFEKNGLIFQWFIAILKEFL